jgi:hypothetical protein
MTATLDGVTTKKPAPTAEAEAARELVRLAREPGLALTGPDGLLKQLTKTVIETALNEMTGHLGYAKHDPAGQGTGSGNVRNGTRPKTVSLAASLRPRSISQLSSRFTDRYTRRISTSAERKAPGQTMRRVLGQHRLMPAALSVGRELLTPPTAPPTRSVDVEDHGAAEVTRPVRIQIPRLGLG